MAAAPTRMPPHQATECQGLAPTGVPSSRPRRVCTTGVTGWSRAKPWSEVGSAIMLVSGYVRNAASIEADIEAAVRASGKMPDEWMSSYARTLTRLTDPQRFPALTKFIAAGVFDRADPPEAEFTFGLDRILDGLATLINTRH